MNGSAWFLVLALIFNTGLQISKGFTLEEKGKEIAALKDEIDKISKACEHEHILKTNKMGK